MLLYIQIYIIGDIEMTTPPTTKSTKYSRKRSQQEEVTDFSDDGKLIIICFSEHVETFKNNLNYTLYY